MTAGRWILLAAACGLVSCSTPPPPEARPRPDPLAVQQRRALPEAASGRFISLADFEDAPGTRGYEQVGDFSIDSDDEPGELNFTVNITHTGSGAMEAELPPDAGLRFDLPDIRNFTGYTLLNIAIHTRQFRDDLEVTLSSGRGEWTSPRQMMRPGWNTVEVDLRRLMEAPDFDVTDVRSIRLGFAVAADAVRFVLDDILLIDNRRDISPVPEGVEVRKAGLDYRVNVPGMDEPIRLVQSDDGFWRLAGRQPAIALGAGPTDGERLDVLGERRTGDVELAEHNELRARFVYNWYFPRRAGAWASMAVRHLRWEQTFYRDGRWVTSLRVNAGGAAGLDGVSIRLPDSAAIAGAGPGREIIEPGFAGPFGQWSWLLGGVGEAGRIQERNYLSPASIRILRGREDFFADGDTDRNRFDQSRGCYVLAASDGRCRFTIVPGDEPVVGPVFRIHGPWSEPPMVSAAGLVIRDVVLLDDGSALFMIPTSLAGPAEVEVSPAVGRAARAGTRQ